MKLFILNLNPFVRGVATMVIAYALAHLYYIGGSSLENAIMAFFMFTVLIYEAALVKPGEMPMSLLILVCRGVTLVVGGFMIKSFFALYGPIYGAAAMILIYELAILPRRER